MVQRQRPKRRHATAKTLYDQILPEMLSSDAHPTPSAPSSSHPPTPKRFKKRESSVARRVFSAPYRDDEAPTPTPPISSKGNGKSGDNNKKTESSAASRDMAIFRTLARLTRGNNPGTGAIGYPLNDPDIVDQTKLNVKWGDIIGLNDAKRVLYESLVLPYLIPDVFTGLRSPPRGILLVGTPGTGKTMLAKAVATECRATFFNIAASTLTSKWMGEAEKRVRDIFHKARCYAPSIVFIDEIDAVCSRRGTGNEHEASRRVKSEILVQMDGLDSEVACQEDDDTNDAENMGGGDGPDNQGNSSKTAAENETKKKVTRAVTVLAATNFPWDLDEGVRRRLEKRILIPLPDLDGRRRLLEKLFENMSVAKNINLHHIAKRLGGYSNADVKQVAREAAMNVIRRCLAAKELSGDQLTAEHRELLLAELRKSPIQCDDFAVAIRRVGKSVDDTQVRKFDEWIKDFGSS